MSVMNENYRQEGITSQEALTAAEIARIAEELQTIAREVINIRNGVA